MTKILKILNIEDNEDDTFLIQRALKKGGYSAKVTRVETAGEIERELNENEWDIILSDFDLPNYSGIAALELIMSLKSEVPFILVSGAVGEKMAVELMRKGAVDYVMKDNLSRLVPVIERELSEAENRRIIKKSNQAMQSMVKSIVGTTGEDSFEKILQGLCNWVGAESGLIGLIEDDSIQTISCIIQNEKVKEFQYQISGSPCEIVMKEGYHLYPENVRSLFPNDRDLVDMGLESYVGVPLKDPSQAVIGVMCILSKQAMNAPGRIKEYMEIVAAKAASEIERIKSEKLKVSLEDQLRHAQKMESIGRLTGGIAHDFNNIMGIIVGNTELALEDIPEWNQAHANLEEIKAAGLRAASIVKQLLSFSRKTSHEFKNIEIIPIVEDTLKLLRPTIPATIDIHKNLSANQGTIKADSVQINQIIINLCINAFHAMEETGGDLTINIENITVPIDQDPVYPDLAKGSYVKMTVTDTGSGIEPEIVDQIFDPYFTTKGVGKGSGMGLSVVHGIVNNHDGKIFVQSQPGKGTSFTIFFPSVVEEIKIKKEPIKTPALGKETILFVDDENAITIMARQMLERLGYKAEIQTDPVKALGLFQQTPNRFDLVITDMTMPHMNGIKLSEELVKIRPNIPIILCSGHSSLINEEKALQDGFAAYIRKPITKVDISNTIRNVMDKKKE